MHLKGRDEANKHYP